MNFSCKICDSRNFEKILEIFNKPPKETNYNIPEDKYYREILRCKSCGVYLNKHKLLNDFIYSGSYNESIPLGSLKTRFEKIINLPYEKSDNKRRVDRVIRVLKKEGFLPEDTSVLDIGSGTCVFLYEMKKYGLKTYCIDPDKNAIHHAVENVKVDYAVQSYVNDFRINMKFDLITLNKVLEHLDNPLAVVKKVKTYIKKNGLLYIEVPHSDPVVERNIIFERSEFFVEHLTIYNRKSLQALARLSNLEIVDMHEIVDPSGKYTIYAFFKKKDNA